MQYPVLNLLGPSLIPELRSDISAGSSRYKELILIPVATVRAFPYQLSGFVLDDLNLSVITADFTEITLGIQLCIHDILINVL